MWFLLAACPAPEKTPSDPPIVEDTDADTTETTPPDPDTTPTGDTAAGTSEPTVPVACANLPVVGPPDTNPEIDVDPLPFDTRLDGSMWFGSREGVFAGASPTSAIEVWPTDGEVRAVREAPDGTLWFAADGLWRVPPGGVPEQVVEDVVLTDDLEIHPSGSVLLASWDVVADVRTVVFVDPAGVPEIHDSNAFPIAAVAWSTSGELWLLADDGLWTLPADGEGRPDWSVAPTQVVPGADLYGGPGFYGPQGGDLAADACGGVLIAAYTHPLGAAFRYDPATSVLTRLPGTIDQGYGSSPLRFGKLPGTETLLRTSSGGWTTSRKNWVTWDIGVGAP